MTNEIMAKRHSKDGQLEAARLIEYDPSNKRHIVEFSDGVKCTAIFNPFVCAYYADDKYGLINQTNQTLPEFPAGKGILP